MQWSPGGTGDWGGWMLCLLGPTFRIGTRPPPPVLPFSPKMVAYRRFPGRVSEPGSDFTSAWWQQIVPWWRKALPTCMLPLPHLWLCHRMCGRGRWAGGRGAVCSQWITSSHSPRLAMAPQHVCCVLRKMCLPSTRSLLKALSNLRFHFDWTKCNSTALRCCI